MTITIKAARDAEARVWYIADSDLPGLNLEGESLDELYDKLFHGIDTCERHRELLYPDRYTQTHPTNDSVRANGCAKG